MIDTDAYFSRKISREFAKIRKAARDKINQPTDPYILIETSKGHWRSVKASSLNAFI